MGRKHFVAECRVTASRSPFVALSRPVSGPIRQCRRAGDAETGPSRDVAYSRAEPSGDNGCFIRRLFGDSYGDRLRPHIASPGQAAFAQVVPEAGIHVPYLGVPWYSTS